MRCWFAQLALSLRDLAWFNGLESAGLQLQRFAVWLRCEEIERFD